MRDGDDLIPIEGGFPRPRWNEIAERVEACPESERDRLWDGWARRWVERTAATLPGGYRVSASENFLLLAAQGERYVSLLLRFLERARARILGLLPGIASDDGCGRHVVLVFDDQESYYGYLSHYLSEEGEFPLSAGVFLNAEYGHFAFPFLELSAAESTSTHELAHACLRHLPLPRWLDEGLAIAVQDEICGSPSMPMDAGRFRRHAAFWNEATIQEFWSGAAFERVDEGRELSYELARLSVASLAREYEAFAKFANSAHYDDGGEAAARHAFGASLGGLIERFFGEGDWSPRPGDGFAP